MNCQFRTPSPTNHKSILPLYPNPSPQGQLKSLILMYLKINNIKQYCINKWIDCIWSNFRTSGCWTCLRHWTRTKARVCPVKSSGPACLWVPLFSFTQFSSVKCARECYVISWVSCLYLSSLCSLKNILVVDTQYEA